VSCPYEARCFGFEPARAFKDFGWSVKVFNPSDIKRKRKFAYQKTDKTDARLICRELRDNRLVCIMIPDRKRSSMASDQERPCDASLS